MAKTLKEIAEYAKSIAHNYGKNDWRMDDAMGTFIGEESLRVINNVHYYIEDSYYAVELNFRPDYSALIGDVYDYDEYKKYCEELDAIDTNNIKSIEDFPPAPDTKFIIVVPDTRGFSDTSNRIDTKLDYLDIDCAIDEAIDEHEGRNKVQPWMLKQFINADELGIEEEELDYELECICGL